MCRYGITAYKPHLACFNCRKTFKRRLLKDIHRDSLYSETYEQQPAKCPECGNHVVDMGLDFESPKKNDTRAWKHIEGLYSVGITFHSCGCTGPGYIPNDTPEIKAYLERIRTSYLNQYQFWAQKKENPETQSEISKDQSKNWTYYGKIEKEYNLGNKKLPKYDIPSIQSYWNAKIKEIDSRIKRLSS